VVPVSSDLYGPQWFLVAVTVGVTLVGIVLWGYPGRLDLPSSFGASGSDPAGASSGAVRGDARRRDGLVIYFSVAA
jgi:magnesium transporter